MDYFAKWPEANPIPEHETFTLADVFMKKWVSRSDTPLQILTDSF